MARSSATYQHWSRWSAAAADDGGDTLAPTVLNVTATNANGTYGTTTTIAITVQFTEAVLVTGTPVLALNTGGTASYVSGSGTDTITLNYTPAYGQVTFDLDYVATGSLTAGTIADAAGNPATRTLAVPTASGSLSANKAIIIWPPGTISGMVIGCDPYTGVTVSQWDDKSGNSNHLVASGTAPVASTLNSLNVLTFASGTGTFKTAGNTGITGDASFSMVTVAKASQTAVTTSLMGGGVVGTRTAFGFVFDVSTSVSVYYFAGDVYTTVAVSTDTLVLTATKTPGNVNTTTTIRVNGTAVTNGGTAAAPNLTDAVFILNKFASTNVFRGQIGCCFLFNKTLSAGEVTIMESHVNALFAAF